MTPSKELLSAVLGISAEDLERLLVFKPDSNSKFYGLKKSEFVYWNGKKKCKENIYELMHMCKQYIAKETGAWIESYTECNDNKYTGWAVFGAEEFKANTELEAVFQAVEQYIKDSK